MKLFTRCARPKAGWKSALTFGAVALMFLAGAAPAMAAGRHENARRTRPGGPNANAKGYRLDEEPMLRASHLSATLKTRVIVELKPGATLPPQFAKYAKRNGLLKILNGQVVDLPNGLLTQLAAHPSVF